VSTQFRVNQPAVIHQTLDGETVIIHLERGLYYSLDATGAEIWQALAAGLTPADVSDRLRARYPDQRAEVGPAVLELVDRLRSEELIVPTDGNRQEVAETLVPADAHVTNGRFESPRLERFDDLHDLLLLDPIHAVDESGWPERP
jgi:hypothetical protein